MPVKLSDADYRERLREATGGKIELIGEFIGTSKQVLHRCVEGHDLVTKPINLLHSKGNCRHCYKPKLRRSDEQYAAELQSRFNGRIVAAEPYAGYTVKIKHRCTRCNNVWRITPNNTLFGHGCPNCVVNHRGKYRKVRIGDVERTVQGFEDVAIDHLLNNLKVDPKNIVVATGEGKPRVPYLHRGKLHMYTPDIYFPPKNRIIEVKSLQTMGVDYMMRDDPRGHAMFDVVAAKARACVDLEYDFTLMVFRERRPRAKPLKVYKHWFTRGSHMFLDYLIEEGLI